MSFYFSFATKEEWNDLSKGVLNMDEMVKFCLERIKLADLDAVNKVEALVSIFILIAIFAIYEVIKSKTSSTEFNLDRLVVRTLVSIIISYICLVILGNGTVIIGVIVGCTISIFLYERFFNTKPLGLTNQPDPVKIKKSSTTEITKKFIQDKLRKHPNPNILDILEWYGYISINQKGKIFANNIWDSPEVMAEKFTHIPALTMREYKEAMAIMNILHMEDFKVGLSKQEALEIVTKIVEAEDEINLEGTDDEKDI